MMVAWDSAILLWVNRFVQASPSLDKLIVLINGMSLLRGVVVVALLWYVSMDRRMRLVTEDLFWPRTMAGIVAAILLGRGLQNLLPARARPLHDASLDLTLPAGVAPDTLQGWSSFPSDHAMLFAALVTAIFLVHRGAGLLAAFWALVMVLLPRVYLALHYPSDLLAGAALGVAVMLAAQRVPAPRGLADRLMRLEDRHRGMAFSAAFLFSFLCATVFDDLRSILRLVPAAVAALQAS
ncbi:phosphatase PAP2 family protein [Marinimicrococcus flavescens]|uniref:Phosphatase PAP2 family protein n=1 Tax=Marinimicrococcus flavescens TaxID=3031815 RepID=A0AAP3XQS4_9PROT|nr:phosphatase PAP2 family protein [Marinimicrococcus flavescens]